MLYLDEQCKTLQSQLCRLYLGRQQGVDDTYPQSKGKGVCTTLSLEHEVLLDVLQSRVMQV